MIAEHASELGQRVRARREALGIKSMRAAAKRAGISDDTWRRVERGDPTVSDTTLDAVARALEVPGAEVYRWAGRAYRPVEPPVDSGTLEKMGRIVDNLTQSLAALADEIHRLGKQGR